MFTITLYMRYESTFQEWVDNLKISEFYIGINILIFGSFLAILVSVSGCFVAALENPTLHYIASKLFIEFTAF